MPSKDDKPFVVKVPVDEWLCRKFDQLNITVWEGYLSRTSETSGLNRDQIVNPPLKTTNHFPRSTLVRFNSSFPRIASPLLPSASASQLVSQDTRYQGPDSRKIFLRFETFCSAGIHKRSQTKIFLRFGLKSKTA